MNGEYGGRSVELIEKIMDGTGEKIKALAIELTQIRSVVGTEGEIAVAKKVYEYLAQLDYFQRNPRQLRLMPVKDDELGRLSVFAMIAGKQTENKDTLLCIGHIDTVGVADYGGLQDMATNPAQLKQSLATATKFSEPAFSELQSEDWLLGRGLLDMKTGVAALMVMMEEFSRQPEKLAGNLVFYAVPDEEGNSAGMLSAVADLAEMKAQRGWNFVAAIDTDFMTFRYPATRTVMSMSGRPGSCCRVFSYTAKKPMSVNPSTVLTPTCWRRKCCAGSTSIPICATLPTERWPCRRSACINATTKPSIRFRRRIRSICTSTTRPTAVNRPRFWPSSGPRQTKLSRR